jgi:hypothetical protein
LRTSRCATVSVLFYLAMMITDGGDAICDIDAQLRQCEVVPSARRIYRCVADGAGLDRAGADTSVPGWPVNSACGGDRVHAACGRRRRCR